MDDAHGDRARLAEGFAQRAPLAGYAPRAVEVPAAARRVTSAGWHAWRGAGPVLLLATVFGGGVLWVAGTTLLAGAFGALVFLVAARREPYAEAEVRLVNAVLGGTLVLLGIACAAGVCSLGLLGGSTLFGSAWLATAAFKLIAVAVTGTAAVISVAGWVPEPWAARRLIRV